MRGTDPKALATTTIDDVVLGDAPHQIAEGGRRNKTVWLREKVYVELALRARAAGVPFGTYIQNALLQMRTPLPTSAEIAAPLAQVSYRLAKIADFLEGNDLGAARSDLVEARQIIAQALVPLRREYGRQVHDLAHHVEGWTG
jgi:hypothetical protein